MTDMHHESINRREAERLLLDAMENISRVSDGYEDLPRELRNMLGESHAGLAAVRVSLNDPVVMADE